MAKDHKLYTEATRGGVIAECQGEGCDWLGKYTYTKSPHSVIELRAMAPEQRAEVKPITVESQVFPNRQLAVAAHKEHHTKKDNNGRD